MPRKGVVLVVQVINVSYVMKVLRKISCISCCIVLSLLLIEEDNWYDWRH